MSDMLSTRSFTMEKEDMPSFADLNLSERTQSDTDSSGHGSQPQKPHSDQHLASSQLSISGLQDSDFSDHTSYISEATTIPVAHPSQLSLVLHLNREIDAEADNFILESSEIISDDSYLHMNTGIHQEDQDSLDLKMNNANLLTLENVKWDAESCKYCNLNDNYLSNLLDLPNHVSVLHVKNNRLDNLTSFSHLIHLRYLDISNNNLTDLSALECLTHLSELIAADNGITHIQPLKYLSSLIKLDLRGNRLTLVEGKELNSLWRLESLDLSNNRITSVKGLNYLKALRDLNLENNLLSEMPAESVMENLCQLNLNDNSLHEWSTWLYPRLENLKLDRNCLESLVFPAPLPHLKSLSMESQRSHQISVTFANAIALTRLNISDNIGICSAANLQLPSNLEHLNASQCKLQDCNFGIKNLLYLDVSGNKISSIKGVIRCKKLKTLQICSNSLVDFKELVKVARYLFHLKHLDTRFNPLTQSFYSTEASKLFYIEPLDFQHVKQMTDAEYVKRMCYRSVLIYNAQELESLDQLPVTAQDRQRAQERVRTFKKVMKDAVFEGWEPELHPLISDYSTEGIYIEI